MFGHRISRISLAGFVRAAPLLAVVTCFATSPARAQGTASDKAVAEALFRAAKELQAQGKISEACPKYAESHRLDPKPGTVLNLATCHELEGRTASAWVEYSEAATLASRARQADRDRFARRKVDELAKSLSYVTLRFPEVAGLEVTLDGKSLTSATAGTRIPIDPGPHALAARAPNKVAWSSNVKIDPGPAEQDVVIPPLADEVAPVVVASPPPVGAAPVTEPPSPERRDHATQRLIGWIAVGAGAAGVGAGGFFGLRTLSKKSTVDEHCTGPRCDDEGLKANDDAKSAATISTIAFAAGGALLVTGVILLLTGRDGGRERGSAGMLHVAAIGPSAIGGAW